MNIIGLKAWPEYFEAILDGRKTFEIREDDRAGYEVGDVLCLREWVPQTGEYTGREYDVQVTYVVHGPTYGLNDGWVVMAIVPREGGRKILEPRENHSAPNPEKP